MTTRSIQSLQHGEYEARCFASARLRARENIATRQNCRNSLELDGGRRGVTLFGDSTQQLRLKPEIRKLH
jgi:hypothetical protein